MNRKENLIFIAGVLITLFGFFISAMGLIAMTDTIVSTNESIMTDITMFLIIGIVPLLFGLFLCFKMRKRAKKRSRDDIENKILKLAATMKGKITIAEAAANTKLSFQEAEQLLENFVRMGVAERNISDGGVFVYLFIHVISKDEKLRSKNLTTW